MHRYDVNKRALSTRRYKSDRRQTTIVRAAGAEADRVIRDNTSCTSLLRSTLRMCIGAVHNVSTRAHKHNLFDSK